MKLTIERSALLTSLSHVQSVVERRNTIPILSNVLLHADDARLSLTTTDMDLEIIESVAANVLVPGTLTTPAHTLYDIVRKLPDGVQIELTQDAGVLVLKSGRSTFQLGCLPTEDFPQMTGGDMPYKFTVDAAEIRTLIDRTRFAISMGDTRHYLSGIYLHAASSNGTAVLRTVATDGHRLAQADIPLPAQASSEMQGVILPRKVVSEIRKLIDETTNPIEISLSPTKIHCAVGKILVTSKLVDGVFPDYHQVIPKGNDKILEVSTKVLADAVDRVSTVATEKSRAIRLDIEQNVLTISANSPEQGSASEEIEVKSDLTGLSIGFNARYLLDIIQQIKNETCRLILADGSMPAIIQDVADQSALYVIMPMRV